MTCKEVEEMAGAYALGALPADSLREIERHLSSCSQHPDIAELSAVARRLALAAPDAEPPSALKARIMDAVRRESPGAPDRRPTGSVPNWLEKLVPRPRLPYALATALAVVLAVTLFGTNALRG